MARSNLPEKIILGIFILSFIVLIGEKVIQARNAGADHVRINILVPYGLIAGFISFYYFRKYNQDKKAKRENRREYLNERRQELLDNILKKNKQPPPKDD